ncbi:MAG: PIN-like domain-containing protein [Ferruginibacter sp.]
MKTKFPGYFKLEEKELHSLWENALFAFDANILLNLYRYSDETREDFFKILEKIKDRVWIPHQAAQEFFDNRLSVISQQEKSYEDAIASLNTILKDFENSRQHPFLSNKLLSKFSSLTKEICAELNSNKEIHINRIVNDEILEKIQSIFNDKVGDDFKESELGNLITEGEERFKNKIPPGFKDAKKGDIESDTRKFGDFFVWKQINIKSNELKTGIILVTDDRKEDWWVRFKGKTLHPRPELIKEFIALTNQSFYMYQSDRFLEFARDYLNENINQNAIDEIRELRKLDEQERLNQIIKEQVYLETAHARERLFKERIMLESEYNYISEKKKILENKLSEEIHELNSQDPAGFNDAKLLTLQQELKMISNKHSDLIYRIKDLETHEILLKKDGRKTSLNKSIAASGA